MNAGGPYDHDEQLLLIQLRNGNERAFTYFYERHSLIIYRKIKKMVKVDVLADELMQDVFVRLWDKRHLIDPEKPLKSYLFLIAQNLVYDFYRKLGREERLQSEVMKAFTETYLHTEEEVFARETQDILNKAVEHLPPQQQLVFRLCKLEGKTYEQVSQELGISTATINTHIVRATKSIKEFMFNYNHVAMQVLLASVITDLARKL
ncbi:RNA polymerase sigma factor [Mucilaginibacter sp. OK098]|uniref:RNA polymerase sigma factor n=1 Tax=Mucilaginibacter sp. OK098 TaxID=1855297 RepID=UPI000911F432|nr:sigma-70 family RNA polymerase sigma factor [Mucilaginibacter sp. OK098]SHL96286.1 RNA polymerase sigma-70 factor, ECF subfamily [Mucilaginibacter sp. OK098]